MFEDPDVLVEDEPDPDEPDPDEERTTTIGLGSGRLLFVASTERGANTRIISARKANRHAQDRYHSA